MSSRGRRRGRAGERGQAIIEVVLVLPLFLLLALVVLDFGMALDRRETVVHAAREAGIAAVYGALPGDVVTTAVQQSDGVLQAADVSVCYIDGPDAGTQVGQTGDAVRISINYQYHPALGGEMLTAFGGSNPTIDISPKAEGKLLKDIAGATAC